MYVTASRRAALAESVQEPTPGNKLHLHYLGAVQLCMDMGNAKRSGFQRPKGLPLVSLWFPRLTSLQTDGCDVSRKGIEGDQPATGPMHSHPCIVPYYEGVSSVSHSFLMHAQHVNVIAAVQAGHCL